MYGFLKGQPSEDEENAAFIHSDRDYGAIPAHDDPATSHSEAVMPIDMSAINGHCYDTNDWDSLAQRKRERLQRRHTSRRKLANRLSSLVLGSGLDRLASQDNPDLVLPALDPSAQEVMASAPSQASLDQWFNTRSNINFSTIRQNYRATHTQLHMGKPESPGFFRRIKQYIYYDTCMATIKKTMYANSTIILFVKADVMVDLLLCFLYLIDMKQEVSVNLDPPWLYKWRSYDLW
ncbi:uncharacterized protein BYT42DRAFT_542319 [Radiomyces spectabilis]|uniref:uncharacterized protein n=1 Tax=Radiomyces spectabilis TaxID=64574 RepID=UPI00221E965F|nr:uncharacterized protein BYT42DRAFT_542319 [Radiomyces spectabilis]KAI8394174.1 hypothetical protein BYT42DRAFT_542319 [Radiomyces spectabilis]